MRKSGLTIRSSFRLHTRIAIAILLAISSVFSMQSSHGSEDKQRLKYADYQTDPADGVPWEWQGVERIVAIGDLHGDLGALLEILTKTQLIDAGGDWIGGRTHLVSMGDLVAGKGPGRYLQEFIVTLQKQAAKAGGAVHALLGNHDILIASGEYQHLSEKEMKHYDRTFSGDESTWLNTRTIAKFYSAGGSLGPWMAKRNMIIKINGRGFVHAGVRGWGLLNSPDRINATARAYIKHWQSGDFSIYPQTAWVVGIEDNIFDRDIGPAFDRGFKVGPWLEEALPDAHLAAETLPGESLQNSEASGTTTEQANATKPKRPDGVPKKSNVKAVLDAWGMTSITLGHAPTPNAEISLSHPYFGAMVKSIDTSISDNDGKLSALEIDARGNEHVLYFERPLKKSPLQKRLTQGNQCRDLFR